MPIYGNLWRHTSLHLSWERAYPFNWWFLWGVYITQLQNSIWLLCPLMFVKFVRLQSPHIYFPENFYDEACTTVVLDLGRVAIHSDIRQRVCHVNVIFLKYRILIFCFFLQDFVRTIDINENTSEDMLYDRFIIDISLLRGMQSSTHFCLSSRVRLKFI